MAKGGNAGSDPNILSIEDGGEFRISFQKRELGVRRLDFDMSQSLARVLVHVVFSTRERRLWITDATRSEMHAYLATLGSDAENVSVRVGETGGSFAPTSRFVHVAHVALHVTTDEVIKTFRHAGLEKFFLKGSKAGIQPAHANKLRLQLAALNNAAQASDMNAPGWDLHLLRGELAGHWAVAVNGNWRVTFVFEGQDATVVDYQDYH